MLPSGDILVSNKKYLQILIRPPVWLGIGVRQVLPTVVNGVQPSEPVVNISRCVDNRCGMLLKLSRRQVSFFSQWWYCCLLLDWCWSLHTQFCDHFSSLRCLVNWVVGILYKLDIQFALTDLSLLFKETVIVSIFDSERRQFSTV